MLREFRVFGLLRGGRVRCGLHRLSLESRKRNANCGVPFIMAFRTRVVVAFPDGQSALMLVSARLRHMMHRRGDQETPIRAPNANAFVKSWISHARSECLNYFGLIFGLGRMTGYWRVTAVIITFTASTKARTSATRYLIATSSPRKPEPFNVNSAWVDCYATIIGIAPDPSRGSPPRFNFPCAVRDARPYPQRFVESESFFACPFSMPSATVSAGSTSQSCL